MELGGYCCEARALRPSTDFAPATSGAQLLRTPLGAARLDLGLPAQLFRVVLRVQPLTVTRSETGIGQPYIDRDSSSESPDLRAFLRELAAGVCATCTLDVYASASSTFSDRYLSAPSPRHLIPVRNGSTPSRSRTGALAAAPCAIAGARTQEPVLLAPPHTAIARALRKAKCDEARVVP